MKVGLAQWTGFDAAPDTLDVAKLGDDAKKLGARYPWVLKEHKRLEAAAREAAEKKRKRLEAAAMEAVAMEAARGSSGAGSRRAMEAAPREADAATDAAVPPPSTREEAAVPPAAIQGDTGPPVPPPPSASIACDEEDAAVNALFTLSEAATRGGRVRKPATPKAAAARDFAYNVLHAAGAEGMPVDSIVELGRRRGVYSGKKAKAEVVSRLTGQLSRDEAFVRVAPRVYARRDALNGDPAPSAADTGSSGCRCTGSSGCRCTGSSGCRGTGSSGCRCTGSGCNRLDSGCRRTGSGCSPGGRRRRRRASHGQRPREAVPRQLLPRPHAMQPTGRVLDLESRRASPGHVQDGSVRATLLRPRQARAEPPARVQGRRVRRVCARAFLEEEE